MWWIRLLILLIGYAFGLIQTGYFYSKCKGVNLKQQGSGNTGATNTLRIMGGKAAGIVFLGDFLKAFIPCFAVRLLFREKGTDAYVYFAYMALGVNLGNNFPFYLKFNGGKGIAAALGSALALNWQCFLVIAVIGCAIVFSTRLVSLGSLCGCVLCIALNFVLGNYLWGAEMFAPYVIEFYIVYDLSLIISILRHHENIGRLLQGKENRISFRE